MYKVLAPSFASQIRDPLVQNIRQVSPRWQCVSQTSRYKQGFRRAKKSEYKKIRYAEHFKTSSCRTRVSIPALSENSLKIEK